MKGFEIELMLLGWNQSHTSGCKVIFAVDEEGLERFKMATERKGKIAGQIYMAVLVPVDQDDMRRPENVKASILAEAATVAAAAPGVSPVTGPTVLVPEDFNGLAHKVGQTHKARFPDGLCGLAVRWCNDLHFHAWLQENYGMEWNTARTDTEVGENPNDIAKAIVCDFCSVESRKQLDTAPGADIAFNKYFRGPYGDAREADGVDANPF